MAIKNIKFNDVGFIWNTKHSGCGLPYNYDEIKKVFEKFIEPKLKLTSENQIRLTIFNIVHDLIKEEKVVTMYTFLNLIMALRLTCIDTNNKDDNGFFKVYIMDSIDIFEKTTYENIIWHINHNSPTYKYCFVMAKGYHNHSLVALSYTSAEWKDKTDYFLDTINKYDMEKSNKERKA